MRAAQSRPSRVRELAFGFLEVAEEASNAKRELTESYYLISEQVSSANINLRDTHDIQDAPWTRAIRTSCTPTGSSVAAVPEPASAVRQPRPRPAG